MNYLLGAIIGDICGQPYERAARVDTLEEITLIPKDPKFTDDTVCTIAVADALLNADGLDNVNFKDYLIKWCRKFPNAGYGKMFFEWFMSSDKERPEIESYGNGSAMRVSPCGYMVERGTARLLATESAIPTHSHEEGVKGARAIAIAVWIARNNALVKEDIYYMARDFYPKFDFTIPISELRKTYKFNCTCQGSVPHAIRCFLECESYEDCIKRAIWLGGDTDTIAAMAGSIAYACGDEEVDQNLIDMAMNCLTPEMRNIVCKFDQMINGLEE